MAGKEFKIKHALDLNNTHVVTGFTNDPNLTDNTARLVTEYAIKNYVYGQTSGITGGQGVVVSLEWEYNNTILSSDPGNGKFRYNDVTLSSVDEIYVDQFTSTGSDPTIILEHLNYGDVLYVQQKDDGTKYAFFTVASATTDETGWWTIPVIYENGGLLPDNDAVCVFVLYGTNEKYLKFLDLYDVNITTYNDGRIPFEHSSGITDSANLTFQDNNLTVGNNIHAGSGITLSNDYFVDELSDDSGLTDASHTALVTEWAIKKYIMQLLYSGLTYTNAEETPETIGGIEEGSTFTDVTLQNMWTDLLYPYQEPVFLSFSNTYQSNYLEVGEILPAGNVTFNWTIDNVENSNDDISIEDTTSGETLATNILAGTPSAITLNVGYTIKKINATSNVWTISGTDTDTPSNTYERTTSRTWRWKFYWGGTGLTSLTSSDVVNLPSGETSATAIRNIEYEAINPPEFKYYCIPVGYSIKNVVVGVVDVDMADSAPYTSGPDGEDRDIYYDLVSVTNQYGIAKDYKVFRTMYELGGKITVKYT